eukprot:2580666-Pyramimonas_sp.AAC.1
MEFRRAARGLRTTAVRDPSWHDWREIDSGVAWRCTRCFAITWDQDRSMIGCKGVPTAFRNLKDAEERGHLLACAMIDNEAQEPLVFCYRCGAYSSKRCVLLAGRCCGKLGTRSQTLYRVKQGLHPHFYNDNRVTDP